MTDVLEKIEEGKKLLNANKLKQAERVLSECCAQNPEDSDVWFSLGVCRHRQRKAESAMLAFERAVHFDPKNIAAQNAKANMLANLGRTDEALEVTLQALRIDPNNVKSLTNHASLLFQAGYFTEALHSLNHVLDHAPYSPRALENRAVVLNRLGRSDEALVDAVKLAEVLPTVSPYILQTSALMALSRFKYAVIAAERALFIESENIHALVLLATAQAAFEQYGEAEKSFRFAESLDAQRLGKVLAQQVLNLPAGMRSNPLSLYLSLAEKRMKLCDWNDRAEYLIVLQAYLQNVDRVSASDTDIQLLKASCYAGIDPLLQLELAKFIAKDAEEKVEKFTYEIENMPERIRVGYLAKSFNEESMTRSISTVFDMHNRAEFEVYCYSMEPSDNSEVNQKIRKGCDQFTELYPRTDSEIAELLHEDRLHILVDLEGIEQQYSYDILARQVAPIQLGFAGMSFSSGAEFIQYRITDSRVSPPSSDKYWSEKLVYLPNTHLVYEAHQSGLRNLVNRSEFALPPTGIVFCCFTKPELMEPVVFRCWLSILGRVPDSVLWLQDWGEEYRYNLRNEAIAYGISPSRLVFSPKPKDQEVNFARYSAADIFLDTFTINGSDTVNDALLAGVPVLSLFGETMANRMTASKLSLLDFPTLICSTVEEYVERADYLASHTEYLKILKRKVQRHVLTKPLFKTQQTVLSLEKAYREIWERYTQGEAPESFMVEEE